MIIDYGKIIEISHLKYRVSQKEKKFETPCTLREKNHLGDVENSSKICKKVDNIKSSHYNVQIRGPGETP